MMRRLVVSALMLLSASSLGAQAPDVRPLVLTLPASTRALALGNAFPLGTFDSDAVFYNPAFVENLRGVAVEGQWFGGEATLFTSSGATEWLGGAAAFGLQALSYAAPLAGEPAEPGLGRPGALPVSERVASVTYARRVKSIRAALTAKLLEQRVGTEVGRVPAVDLAAGMNLAPVRVGLTVQHLGPDLELGGRSQDLPLQATLALTAFAPGPVGPLDLFPTATVSLAEGGRIGAGAGLEVGWWPVQGRTFYGRVGLRRMPDGDASPLTLGAGFSGDRLSLDYAFQSLAGDDATHRLGVRLRP